MPGDIVVLEEGERVPADVRLIDGAIEVDMSALTGRGGAGDPRRRLIDVDVPRLEARDLAFMGATCTEGDARAVVFATGMHTELGRIAALSQRVDVERSPLERQVRRVAWLIAGVAVAMAIAFVPIAVFAAGLSVSNAVVFAVGLMAANVPEGLLPVITLALAVAVSALARHGAVVKRLSAVETLGSTDVICTDKTGTLTENRMHPVAVWTRAGLIDLGDTTASAASGRGEGPALRALADTVIACNNARLDSSGEHVGDPTEIALMLAGAALGGSIDSDERNRRQAAVFRFEPHLKLMSTADRDGDELWLHTKGAPESVLDRCTTVVDADGVDAPLDPATRASVQEQIATFSQHGMRLIATARRRLPATALPDEREQLETGLTLIGLVALEDPPRREVADAVARCHAAGIRIVVITGDHPLT